jgi:hypothetical protein
VDAGSRTTELVRSVRLAEQSKRLGTIAATLRREAADARAQARHLAGRRQRASSVLAPSALRWFELHGTLGGTPVMASWTGNELSCDPPLLGVAQLLADLHELFEVDEPDTVVAATVDGPDWAVMLTLMRACDRVTAAEFVTR